MMYEFVIIIRSKIFFIKYEYRDAKDYLLKYNTPIQTFSNFEVKD